METECVERDEKVVIEVEEILIVENQEGHVKEVVIVEEVIVEEREDHESHHEELIIFVNRLKKTEKDGVKREMSGGEIADLAKIPRENAVVKREQEDTPQEVGIETKITICKGEHFLVTRHKVDGGHG